MPTMKYLEDGRSVHIVKKLEEGYVVRAYYQDCETSEDMCVGPMIFVERVFDKPPLHRFHKTVEELRNAVIRLQEQRNKLRKEVEELETKSLDLDDALSKHSYLYDITRLFDGKFTHCICRNHCDIEIKNMLELGLNPRDFSVYIDGHRKISYFKGSFFTRYTRVEFASSLEEAHAVAKKIVLEWAKETRRNTQQYVVELAERFHVQLPTEYICNHSQKVRSEREAKRKRLEEELAKLDGE